MADFQYMTWGPDWAFVDDMSNFAATGWTAASGGAVAQQAGYVRIDQSAGTDQLFKSFSGKTLPYTFDMEVRSKGTANAFMVADSVSGNRLWVYFPDTGGDVKYYRLIVRQFNTKQYGISLYENGVLIKNKADLVETSASDAIYYYVSTTAVAGDYLEIYTHKHTFGADFGPPSHTKMVDPIYFDGRSGYELLFNLDGTGMAPRSFVEDRIPFEAGSIYRQTIVDPRDIKLGLKVTGTSKSDLNNKMRALRRAMLNQGKLFIKMSDGYRYLNCRYSHGLEGEINTDVTGQLTQLVSLNFRAFDPYWWGVTPNWKGYGFALGSAQTRTITNNGDVETWPEFYIYGPGVNPQVKNLTTGQDFRLVINLATNNDFVYVRTQPGNRTITDKNGNVIWSNLSTGKNTFFSLVPGDNSVLIQFTGAGTDSTTTADVYYYDRYEGE